MAADAMENTSDIPPADFGDQMDDEPLGSFAPEAEGDVPAPDTETV
jgi:hypothetical protein